MGRGPACIAETMENLPVERAACAALLAPGRPARHSIGFEPGRPVQGGRR